MEHICFHLAPLLNPLLRLRSLNVSTERGGWLYRWQNWNLYLTVGSSAVLIITENFAVSQQRCENDNNQSAHSVLQHGHVCSWKPETRKQRGPLLREEAVKSLLFTAESFWKFPQQKHRFCCAQVNVSHWNTHFCVQQTLIRDIKNWSLLI